MEWRVIMNKIRIIPKQDMKCFPYLVPFFGEYKDGVYCTCKNRIILFKNRNPYETVKIICPTCGREIIYG